jgi:arylsulfatase A-like enzyme
MRCAPLIPVLLATCAAAACSRAPSSAPGPVVSLDLARRAWSADATGPWDYVVFGTPAAARFQIDGFVTPLETGRHERFLWGRQDVELRVGGAPGASRRVVVDIEPHPGAARLRFDPYYNGRRLATVHMARKRRRYVLDLPATPAGDPPENELRLFFRGVSRNTRGYGGRISAAFYSLTSGPAGDAALAALADPAVAAPLSVEETDGVPILVQAPGSLRYVFRAGAGAELRFTPGLDPRSAATGAELHVTLEDPGAVREIWRGRVPDDAREVRLALLPGKSGLAALALHVAGPGTARARWTAPRVVSAPSEPLFGPVGEADAAVDRLRESIAGMNVMLVILDAAGARHFSGYGYGRTTTPEIDRLATEGVVFERAYTPAVYTLPAMSSAFTGLEPDEHGSVDLHRGRLPSALCLAEVLSARGIHTAAFVANGVVGRMRGFQRGFAEFVEMYRSAYDPTDVSRLRGVLHPWLEANKARRFFAWVHVREPHFPYDPPPPFDTAFGPDGPIPKALRSEIELLQAIDHRRRPAVPSEIDHIGRLYDGNLAHADAEVGALRRKLEETGLLDRTVLIVAADHGEGLFEHGHIGHEVQVYEELTHIPLIVRFPRGHGPAGARIRELVSLTDLAPTIADLFGLWADRATRPAFRSNSLLSVVTGASGRRAVVSRDRGMEPRYAIREGDTKSIVTTASGATELYDLGNDPEETKDLAGGDPLRAAYYRQTLAAWVLDRKREGVSEPIRLSAEQQENMKALGYLQ